MSMAALHHTRPIHASVHNARYQIQTRERTEYGGTRRSGKANPQATSPARPTQIADQPSHVRITVRISVLVDTSQSLLLNAVNS
jgi:hypothetical protein